MIFQSTKKRNTEILQKEAEPLLGEHQENIRKQAEVMLCKSGRDLTRMSSADIEKLLFELQVHQIELEMQNEELKKTHQELSASRDDFARIYNLSPVAYLSLNEQGIIRKANIAAEQLLGCSTEELVYKKLAKFIHPSDQDNYYYFLHDLVKEKNNTTLNAKLTTKNSVPKPSECQGFALFGCSRSFCSHNNQFTYVEITGAANINYNNDIQICLAIQDITENKHTQETISCLNEKLEKKIVEQTSKLIESNLDLTKKIEELKHSKRQLREREIKLNAIFNASIEGIITINSSGIIQSTNSAVETIFGYNEKELIGCRFNKLMSPSQSKNQDNDLKSYLQAKAPSVIGQIREIEGMRKDGSIILLMCH